MIDKTELVSVFGSERGLKKPCWLSEVIVWKTLSKMLDIFRRGNMQEEILYPLFVNGNNIPLVRVNFEMS